MVMVTRTTDPQVIRDYTGSSETYDDSIILVAEHGIMGCFPTGEIGTFYVSLTIKEPGKGSWGRDFLRECIDYVFKNDLADKLIATGRGATGRAVRLAYRPPNGSVTQSGDLTLWEYHRRDWK
jgi:hypothetical protein